MVNTECGDERRVALTDTHVIITFRYNNVRRRQIACTVVDGVA